MITDPRAMSGDSTAWYTSFRDFITPSATRHCMNDWFPSAEQSLAKYIGSITVSS